MAYSSRKHNLQHTARSKHAEQPAANNQEHHHLLSIYLIAAIASLGGSLLGYDTGLISGAELSLKKDFALNPLTEELAVSAILVGGIVGAAISGKLSNAIGRKKALIVVAIIFAIGATLTTFVPNLWFFIAFRILTGVAVGIASMVTPIYISEMAPPSKRGSLVTFNKLALSVALPLAYGIDLAFIHFHRGWRPMFAMECILGILLGLGMLFLPETPRWLASRGEWDKANQVIEHVAGLNKQEALNGLRKAQATGKHASIRELFFNVWRMALIVGVGLAIFQQFIGVAAISYYSPTIFKFAGFKSSSTDIIATIVTSIDSLISTILAIFLLDRLGRRPLLIASLTGITITLIIMAIVFGIAASSAGYLILISLLIYILAYGLGIGPIFPLVCSEIFPTRLRSTGVSISFCINWVATLLVSITFLSLIKYLGDSLTFWTYAILAIAALAFCWFLVPETRGKSLEQIEEYWEHGGHY